MNPLEITLIIIGILVIAISCKLVDDSLNAKSLIVGKSLSSLEETITETDRQQLMEKMKNLISEVTEETIVRTDDTLSRMSNEKIMMVQEFSDQIMDKIKHNHEEVVFLYNMLNDKETELKAAVREIDSSKKKVQDILESKAESDRIQATKNLKTQTATKAVSQAQTTQNEKPAKPVPQKATEISQELSTVNGPNSNNNSQILALFTQGRSVVEISKLLGIGQGEVKLVIDLFKGKK